jgi:transposase
MGKKLSEDLKWRIIYCYQEGFRTKEIAKRLYVSKTTVIKVCKIFEKWGCVSDPFIGKSGKRKIFTPEDM